MSTKPVKLEIEWTLTDDERTEKARESVRLSKDLDALDDQFKQARADWRTRIKQVKDVRDRAQNAFMTGTEMREIECVEVYNDAKKAYEYIHKGEVIRTRDASLEEQAREGTTPLFPAEPLGDLGDVMAEERSKKRKKDLIA